MQVLVSNFAATGVNSSTLRNQFMQIKVFYVMACTICTSQCENNFACVRCEQNTRHNTSSTTLSIASVSLQEHCLLVISMSIPNRAQVLPLHV